MPITETALEVPELKPQPADWGASAFRQRSWLPVPLGIALLIAAPARATWNAMLLGAVLVVAGEALRLWAVSHIGVISRTRSTARLGPLVTSGPYAVIRNPLYAGNWLLWTGFIIWSRAVWMLPLLWAAFALQYGLISRWEEDVLSRTHTTYLSYAASVGRWIPKGRPKYPRRVGKPTHRWADVLFSERGTLAALVTMALLLIGKQWPW